MIPQLYDNPNATVFIDRGEIVGAWAFALSTPNSALQCLFDAGERRDNPDALAPVFSLHASEMPDGVKPVR